MTLSEELKWRGFINQTTIKDLSYLDDNKLTFYHGFDASADSQQVGNLAAMMLDKAFMRHGHKAILLAGGATSLIGDPGGKDKERQLQSEDQIAKNVEAAERQLKTVFNEQKFTMVNNIDWFKDMNVMEFLRDVGKHFSMTPLVQRDYISQRMGEGGVGISYTEFSYTLLQGYDFLHLYKEHGCTLQISGADQWGNCLSGIDLIRRVEGEEVHAMTMPLIINKATGNKFGKSEEGAVWLDPAKTSPYDFYQFWLNVDDEGVEDYLKIFTELDKEKIDTVMKEFKSDKSSRSAQKTLAEEVTRLVHGDDEVKKLTTKLIFNANEYKKMSEKEINALSRSVEVFESNSNNVIELLAGSGLTQSNSEARRLIESGGVTVNGLKALLDKELTSNDNVHGYVVLRKGKNKQVLVKRS
ncbi:MAG: tyrosine--tRNA ligase [bacterium]|nr:tyrosine--tRNA ligase [bacterium]